MATQLIDEEKMMIDVVRDLAREKVAPRAAEIDAQGEFPWDMKDLLADQGILACRSLKNTVAWGRAS